MHNKKSEELRQFVAESMQLDMKKVDFEKIRRDSENRDHEVFGVERAMVQDGPVLRNDK